MTIQLNRRTVLTGLVGGAVSLLTTQGQGTTTRLEVPITAAVQRVLLVEAAGERVALPISKVERILEVPSSSIEERCYPDPDHLWQLESRRDPHPVKLIRLA